MCKKQKKNKEKSLTSEVYFSNEIQPSEFVAPSVISTALPIDSYYVWVNPIKAPLNL